MTMPAVDKIALHDIVELTESVEDVPAGERGGVLEIFDDRAAMVDVTTLPSGFDGVPVIVAPLDKLRVIEPASR